MTYPFNKLTKIKKKDNKKAISHCQHAQKIHKNVKILSRGFPATSNFEVSANIIVITKATNTLAMANAIPLKNIEEETNSRLRYVRANCKNYEIFKKY